MKASRWGDIKAIPTPVSSALDALRFDCSSEPIHPEEALDFLDRNQLTLVFSHKCNPAQARKRLTANLAGNRLRLERLQAQYHRIASALDSASVKHTVLKGFSHGSDFLPDPTLRCHYDLDLLVGVEDLARAREEIEALGFETPNLQAGRPVDHAAPMVRSSDWQWRGDYFDPDIPAVVELHYRTWDRETEGFDIPTLDPHDRFSYAAAHALRHLLRGNLKAFHIYELAYFLHSRGALGAIGPHEAVICQLARKWFSCEIPSEAEQLSSALQAWVDRYWSSPIAAQFQPNKDEIWLHLEFVSAPGARSRIIRRRLFPVRLPEPLHGTSQPKGSVLLRTLEYSAFVAQRAGFHVLSLARLGLEALSWRATRARNLNRR